LIRLRQRQGLRSQEKRSLTCVNEYFPDKRNEVFGVSLQRIISHDCGTPYTAEKSRNNSAHRAFFYIFVQNNLTMPHEQLKLNNQLCFPVYAASRLIIREYQPLLDKLGITYPQYLVLLVLWENDAVTVNQIAHKLILNTNTITPLLKRMEVQGLITRDRSTDDTRKVVVALTTKGREMEKEAACIPEQLIKGFQNSTMSVEELLTLKKQLHQLIDLLNANNR